MENNITKFHPASEFREIAEAVRRKDAWDILFDRIKHESKKGKFGLTFDEKEEHICFQQHRKEVKSMLEELGFKVEYRRVRDHDPWGFISYHNQYSIKW